MEVVDADVLALYELKERLGKGSYGIVWKAVEKATGDVVALKKNFDAFRNVTDAQRTFREVLYLQEFGDHENIARLRNVIKAHNNKDIYLVFDHMDTDLMVVIKHKLLQPVHLQSVMYQLVKALAYMHSGEVIHRDIKPANILLNDACEVQLADFGLARSVSHIPTDSDVSDPVMTEYLATRWYRAPEILLGSSTYTTAVDMWSAGCVLGEMLLGQPIFQGKSSLHQVDVILQCLGRPSREDVSSMRSPYAEGNLGRLPTAKGRTLRQRFSSAPPQAVDMLERLLVFNPDKRLTAQQALRHPYLSDFHDPDNEPLKREPVKVVLDDDKQLRITEYRDALYKNIMEKRREIAQRRQQAQPSAGPAHATTQPSRSRQDPHSFVADADDDDGQDTVRRVSPQPAQTFSHGASANPSAARQGAAAGRGTAVPTAGAGRGAARAGRQEVDDDLDALRALSARAPQTQVQRKPVNNWQPSSYREPASATRQARADTGRVAGVASSAHFDDASKPFPRNSHRGHTLRNESHVFPVADVDDDDGPGSRAQRPSSAQRHARAPSSWRAGATEVGAAGTVSGTRAASAVNPASRRRPYGQASMSRSELKELTRPYR